MDQKCGTCKFLHGNEHGAPICRRFPPTVQHIVVPKLSIADGGMAPEVEQRSTYPQVLPIWWCGEFQPHLGMSS